MRLLQRKNEIVDNVLVLLSVLYHCLSHLPSEGPTAMSTSINDVMLKSLCEKFAVKQPEHVSPFLDTTSKAILQALNIENKENTISIAALFNIESVAQNIKAFDNLYQSAHISEEIDERMFLNNDTRPLSPYMLSPFQRQSNNCIKTPRKPTDAFQSGQVHNAKRILNYESISTPNESVVKEFNSLADYQKVITMKKMMMSPYTPTPIAATPITRAMENNNWCLEYVSKVRAFDLTNLPPNIIKILTKYLGTAADPRKNKITSDTFVCFEKITKFTKNSKLIMQFYLRTIEELWNLEEKSQNSDLKPLIENDEFYRSVFVASAESVFYIHNETQLTIEKLLELYELPAFSFWKIINGFLRADQHVIALI